MELLVYKFQEEIDKINDSMKMSDEDFNKEYYKIMGKKKVKAMVEELEENIKRNQQIVDLLKIVMAEELKNEEKKPRVRDPKALEVGYCDD